MLKYQIKVVSKEGDNGVSRDTMAYYRHGELHRDMAPSTIWSDYDVNIYGAAFHRYGRFLHGGTGSLQ